MYDVKGVPYRFQFRRYRLSLRAPVRTAHGTWTERDGLLVRLENELGVAGFGEAAVMPWFGTETAPEAEVVCRDLGEVVDADRLASVHVKFVCLRNALAAAAKDLVRVGESAPRPFLAVSALLPAGRGAIDIVRSKEEMGFRTFKWKVGVGDAADELSLLDDVCAVLPEGAKLRLDANGAWDRRRAEKWMQRCADRPVEFVEQPVAVDARGADDLLRGLAGDFPTPIALDESVANDRDIERWVGAGWPGIFVIKTSLLENVDVSLARLAKAKAQVVFSSALETAVGAKAALRLAFHWVGEPRAVGFGVWPLFTDQRCDGPFAAPFIRWEDVERLNEEAVWNALS